MAPDPWKTAASAAMDRYASGDDAAFGELYDHLAPRLHAFLRRRTRDDARAEDLLQQTMLQMHASRRHFSPGAPVVPWAFAIARRILIDAHRKARREVLDLDEPGATERPSPSPSTLAVTVSRQLLRRIEAALQSVSDTNRVAFELVKLDGLEIAEVAGMLGTTEPPVRLRVHRALAALREKLGQDVQVGPAEGS
jgi:RNA polymerase sigma-70 factor (ECF subfamily)